MTAALYFLGVCVVLHAVLNFTRSMIWLKSRMGSG